MGSTNIQAKIPIFAPLKPFEIIKIMKKRIILLTKLLAMWCLTLQAQPAASFDYTTFDLGSILWKRPTTTTFVIKNKGNQPLIINHVETSCGCTEAKWTESPILPGKSGDITVTYDALQLGRFHKFVDVYTNATEEPFYLTLKGQVCSGLGNYDMTFPHAMGTIRLDRQKVEFENAVLGKTATAEINLINTGEEEYRPTLMHLPSYIQVEAVPATLKRKESGKLILTLNTEQLPRLGLTQSKVYLARHVGDKVSAENEIKLSTILLPNLPDTNGTKKRIAPIIRLSDEELDFGKLGKKKRISKNVTITNSGVASLKIQELQVFNPALSVVLKKRTIAPGESVKLKVTVVADYLKTDSEELKVLMITNDPQHPLVTIQAKAGL